MKVFLTALLFGFLSSATFASDIAVKVNGMVCSLCAQGIQKKFSALESVQEIKVDLDSKLVTIKTKEAKNISDDEIKKIINEAGYNVANIERK